MKIYNQVNNEDIRKASLIVMKHFLDKEFLDRVEAVDRFNYTEHSPLEVSLRLKAVVPFLEIYIKPYKTLNPFSRVIGYAQSNTIFVNTRKIDLPYYERVENIAHETLHLCGYKHRGNYVNAFNLKTVPYMVGSIFKNYVVDIYR